jgi:branched-chain amino acid transport system permease protein
MDNIATTAEMALPRYAGMSLRAWKILGLAMLLCAAVALPFLVSSYRVFQFNMVLIYAIVLLGLNILT